MTEERIDIQINDKINPKVAEKLKAIASAAREAESSITTLKRNLATIDTSSVTQLAGASAKVASAQARQTSATARLTNATVRQENSAVKVATANQRLAQATAKTAAEQSKASIAATRATSEAVKQEIVVSRLAATKIREAAALDAATQAQRLNNRIRQQGNRSQAQSIQQTQNLLFQLNDIVVGLASGQKPLTVLIQQGSQISTIYGPGKGVLGTMRLLGASLATIFVPLIPVIATVAVLGAGFAALTYEIDKTTKTQVSFGDTFKAVFQVAGNSIREGLLPAIKEISPIFKITYDVLVGNTKTAINSVVGLFVFAYNSITKTFGLMPDYFKDTFAFVVNVVISAVQDMVNASLTGLNAVIDLANTAANKLGRDDLFSAINNVDLSGFKQEYKGTFQEVGKIIEEEFNAALSKDYAGAAFDAIREQAIKNAQERLAKEEKASNKELSEKEKLLRDIKQPYTDYVETLKNANALLREGRININEYNATLAKTELATSVGTIEAELPQFADQAAINNLRTTQQEQLALVRQAVAAKARTEQEGADLIYAINKKLHDDINAIEVARSEATLLGAQSTFDSLASISETFAGKQSALYQVMFGVSKAFAIADSIIKIQQGIANAAAIPFPANIAAMATVASAAANIVSSIQAVQFSVQGRKDGGYIAGPGTGRSDSIPTMLSNGEFVINAAATARNRPLLEAINDNRPVPANNNFKNGAGGGGVVVHIENYGTSKDFDVQSISPNEVRIIARDEATKAVKREAPTVVASDLGNPNGSMSKALARNTDAARRRA